MGSCHAVNCPLCVSNTGEVLSGGVWVVRLPAEYLAAPVVRRMGEECSSRLGFLRPGDVAADLSGPERGHLSGGAVVEAVRIGIPRRGRVVSVGLVGPVSR